MAGKGLLAHRANLRSLSRERVFQTVVNLVLVCVNGSLPQPQRLFDPVVKAG
jgi:hypothetical protein